MFNAKQVGRRLKELRVANGCKQDEVALGLKLAQSSVSAHELGTSTPPASALYWYAERYNVSVDYILGLIDDPVPLDKEKAAALREAEQLSGITADMVPEILKGSQEFQKFVADLVRQELEGSKNQP